LMCFVLWQQPRFSRSLSLSLVAANVSSFSIEGVVLMNTPLEYMLVGFVTLGVLIYLVIALLAPEKFYSSYPALTYESGKEPVIFMAKSEEMLCL
jgi:F subunit of K+-transporting ATPase (Potass_KdpF)